MKYVLCVLAVCGEELTLNCNSTADRRSSTDICVLCLLHLFLDTFLFESDPIKQPIKQLFTIKIRKWESPTINEYNIQLMKEAPTFSKTKKTSPRNQVKTSASR